MKHADKSNSHTVVLLFNVYETTMGTLAISRATFQSKTKETIAVSKNK